MKVIEHILKAKEPLISYEIVPPPRGRSVKDIIDAVELLAPHNPPWIDVTSHSSSADYQEMPDGTIQRKTYRKRPGTLGICGIIQNRFRIDTVAHMLCLGFTREETEDALIELNFLGIHNVLALRGDAPNFKKVIARGRTENKYANDLVAQIHALRQGQFLDRIEHSEPLDFGIGVAAYPEKHFEAASLKTDIKYLAKKVEAGADYIVTQMFFDNQVYFKFVKEAREAGITVPIVPGIKVLRTAAQLTTLPKAFHIDIPDVLVDEVRESPEHAGDIGQEWALRQAKELMASDGPGVHFYVLNDVQVVTDIVKELKK